MYHFLGILSSFFMILSLYGFIHQIKNIHKNKLKQKNEKYPHKRVTKALSIKRMSTYFLHLFAVYIIGLTASTPNYYLVITRLLGCLLLLFILFQIAHDRKNLNSVSTFLTTSFLLILSLILWFNNFHKNFTHLGQEISQALSVIATISIIFGTKEQLRFIKNKPNTKVLSQRMFIILTLKDITAVMLGLLMEFTSAWPLILLNGCSAILNIILSKNLIATNKQI